MSKFSDRDAELAENGTLLPDADYVLTENMAWFTVGPYSVRILYMRDVLQVCAYPLGDECEDPLGEFIIDLTQ